MTSFLAKRLSSITPSPHTKKTATAVLSVIGACLMLAAPSHASAADALQMKLEASKVVKQADGKVTYVPVNTAATGTVVQYKAVYSNTIDKPINDVSVVLPIPMNMSFTGEAYPASAQATVDGKNFADMPLMEKVDGKLVKVPYSKYKALRWNIKMLPANKSASVALNATVN